MSCSRRARPRANLRTARALCPTAADGVNRHPVLPGFRSLTLPGPAESLLVNGWQRAVPEETPGSKTRLSLPGPSRAPGRRDTDGDVTPAHPGARPGARPGADPGSDPALAESYRILRS